MLDPTYDSHDDPFLFKRKERSMKNIDSPRIVEGPKEFEATCKFCFTKFTYTYPLTKTIPNGSCKTGKLYKTGLNCPVCNEFHVHEKIN